MEADEIIVLIPQYMERFKCVGNACEDTCCKFWRIDIDYDTYKKYTKISDPKLRYLVGEYVQKVKGESNKNRYANFKLKEDGYCAFLDEDGLCMFQKKCGEAYLSSVCLTYPRRQVRINDTMECSGAVSCHEVARLMLFDERPMEFDELIIKSGEKTFYESILVTTDEECDKKPILRWLWPLRNISIDILQNRMLSFRERLILLGLFTDKLEEYRDEGNLHMLEQHISKYKRIINSGDLKSLLVDIPSDGYLQFKMIMEMLIYRLRFTAISPSFANILEEFKLGIGYKEGITTEQLFTSYNKIKSDLLIMFDEQFPQVFENYFVNYAFSTVFPMCPSDNLMGNYIRLILNYAILKMFLVGVGACRKGYNKDSVQKVFSAVSITVEHNPQYVDLMVDSVKNRPGGALAYTTVLIQD